MKKKIIEEKYLEGIEANGSLEFLMSHQITIIIPEYLQKSLDLDGSRGPSKLVWLVLLFHGVLDDFFTLNYVTMEKEKMNGKWLLLIWTVWPSFSRLI